MNGFVNGETSGVVGGLASFSGPATTAVNAGTYTVSPGLGGLTADNYDFTAFIDGTLTINRATPIFSGLSSPTITYGVATTALGGHLATSDGLAVALGGVQVTLNGSTQAATTDANGDFSITFATASLGASGSPYAISYSYSTTTNFNAAVDSTKALTVNKANAVISITPNIQPAYDGKAHVATGSAIGVGGEDLGAGLDLSGTVHTNAGTYSGDAWTFAGGPNYNDQGGTIGSYIGQALLNVTADSVSRAYGASDPTLGATYSGFVNAETTSVLGGALVVVDTKDATTGVGSYPGAITASGQTSSNYSITYVAGTLTITAAPLTIAATNLGKTYGQAVTFAGTEFTTSGLVNGDAVAGVTLASPGSPATAPVAGSPYPIAISNATGTNLGNYSISYIGGNLAVTKAHLTVTAAVTLHDIGHGDTVPIPTVSYSGFVNGDLTGEVSGSPGYGGLPTTSSPAGVYAITPTTAGLTAANYDFPNVVAATLNVHPKITDILVKWGSKTLSILNLNRDLPFANITGLEVKFSDPVDISGSGLALSSIAGGPAYSPTRVGTGLATSDASWNITAIGIDRLMLALDQANIAASAAPSLKLFGQASQGFSVLPGDFNGDGVVSSADVTGVNNATVGVYNVFGDLNGDGVVDVNNDVKLARAKIGTKLPPLA